jgi:hypothetical protein
MLVPPGAVGASLPAGRNHFARGEIGSSMNPEYTPELAWFFYDPEPSNEETH